ncbi:MAG: hypothetical protein ACLQO1_01655 [Steroidobacteraceae bacterium]
MVDLTYEASVQPESLPGRAIPRLPEEANPQAYGTQVGQGIEQAADVLQQVQDRVRQQAIKTQGMDANNKLQALSNSLTHDPKTGAFTKQGKDAFGLDQQYLPQFDQGAQAIIDAVPDPRARSAVEQMVQQHRNQLAEQLDSHELQQHKEYAAKTAQSSVDIATQAAAANYNHPDIIASNRDAIDFSLEDLAKQQGWSPEQLQDATHRAHVNMHQGILTNMLADQKFDMANAYLDTVKGELLPEEYKRATQAIQAGQAGNTAQGIVNAFRSQGPQAGAQAYAQLDQSNLSDEAKDQVREHVRQGLSLLNEQRRTQYPDQITQLETGIASGSPPANARAQADALYHSYALDQTQYASALSGIVRAQRQDDDNAELLAHATDAFSNRQPLDPQNKDNRDAANLLFGKLTNKAPPQSDAYANAAVSIADHVGVVPPDVVSQARASLTGGNPQDAAVAANLLARLQSTNPRAYAYAVDEKTRALVAGVAGPVQAGADPVAALNLARQNANLPKAEVDALKQRWESSKAPAGQSNALATILKSDPDFKPGWFTGLPAVPPLMQGEFNQLTHDYYQQTGGDLTASRQLAAQDLKRTWGVSEVNGKRELMQYAPEAMFPGLSAGVVREDLAKTVQENAAALENVDPTKVRLTATDRTARTGGQEWALSVPDQFGAYDVVRGKDGNPLTYRLPVSGNDYAAVRARQSQADLQKARAARELRDQLRQPGYNEPAL